MKVSNLPAGASTSLPEGEDEILGTTKLATYMKVSNLPAGVMTVLPSGVVFLTTTVLQGYLMVEDVPSDALPNTTLNQAAVGEILTTTLLGGYLTIDNLGVATNHLGTRGSFATRPASGYENVWDSIDSLFNATSTATGTAALANRSDAQVIMPGLAVLPTTGYGYNTVWESIASNHQQIYLIQNDGYLGSRAAFPARPATGYNSVWESIESLSTGSNPSVGTKPTTGRALTEVELATRL
eukprot:scaffold48693_cov68-Phaeocystis_antarctica.AAC.1